MKREAYEEFLPHRSGFHGLSDLVHFAVGEEVDFEVQLSLCAEDVPTIQLGEPEANSCRLGWSSWIGAEDRVDPAEDALIDPRFNRGRAEEFAAAHPMT